MKTLLLTVICLFPAGMSAANQYETAIRNYLAEDIAPWQNNAVIVDAILAQNSRTGAITQAEIDRLDAAWHAEIGAADAPTIAAVLFNPASEFLRDRVAAADGRISEVFVMDARGLNVAANQVTSDYWQGDEAKFIETYSRGPGAVHIGEVEFDESTQTYQSQVSVVIVDPATGAPIGAMTVGLDAAAH